MAGNQGSEQGRQCGQIGGQVNVHIGQHRRRGLKPHLAQGVAPALFGEVDHLYFAQFPRHAFGGPQSAVCAGVVRHSDPERVREGAAQVAVQPPEALFQIPLFVVDRDSHIQHGGGSPGVDGGTQGPACRCRVCDRHGSTLTPAFMRGLCLTCAGAVQPEGGPNTSRRLVPGGPSAGWPSVPVVRKVEVQRPAR